MGRFNLIDEPWIKVIDKKTLKVKMVGLKDLFQNSVDYLCIYGDTRTQDFAILRLCLSVLHTVFSRFDAEGIKYDEIDLNDRMVQTEDVDEDDYEEYKDNLLETWSSLWKKKKFPEALFKYLDLWHDHFYVYDEDYPFYQITKDLVPDYLFKKNGSVVKNVFGKTFKVSLAESGNKTALFSDASLDDEEKSVLSDDEVARWLIAFNGYSGASDKRLFEECKYKNKKSVGWLYQLGGVYLRSNNLFETLLLNLALFNPNTDDTVNYVVEKPCWEIDKRELLENDINEKPITSRAELYTNRARAIYIDPDYEGGTTFSILAVKLPKIDSKNNFVEPMTLYGDRKEEGKDGAVYYVPKLHDYSKSLWRNFNVLIDSNYLKPGVLNWLSFVKNDVDIDNVSIVAVGLESDGKKSSMVPVNEIYDYVDMNLSVLNDTLDGGWVGRIVSIVKGVEKMIGTHYAMFLKGVANLRGVDTTKYQSENLSNVYFAIDGPFKDIIANIQPDDSKDEVSEKIFSLVKSHILSSSKNILKESNTLDYKINETKDNNGKTRVNKNVIQLYNTLCALLNTM